MATSRNYRFESFAQAKIAAEIMAFWNVGTVQYGVNPVLTIWPHKDDKGFSFVEFMVRLYDGERDTMSSWIDKVIGKPS